MNTAFDKAVAAFGYNGVNETGRGTKESGDVRTLSGKEAELDVRVRLERVSDSVTSLEVIARRNVVRYDRALAKQVLDTIAKQQSRRRRLADGIRVYSE